MLAEHVRVHQRTSLLPCFFCWFTNHISRVETNLLFVEILICYSSIQSAFLPDKSACCLEGNIPEVGTHLQIRCLSPHVFHHVGGYKQAHFFRLKPTIARPVRHRQAGATPAATASTERKEVAVVRGPRGKRLERVMERMS